MSAKNLLKAFVLSSSITKWGFFRDFYYTNLKERDAIYDEAVHFIEEYFDQSKIFPTFESFRRELTANQDGNLLQFFTDLETNPDYSTTACMDDATFFSEIQILKKMLYEIDLYGTVSDFGKELHGLDKKDLPSFVEKTEQFIARLHTVKDRALYSKAITASLEYGTAATNHLKELYQNIVDKKRRDEALYYTLGFNQLSHVKICRGDLVVIGGFTSHGKSALLRSIVYRMLVDYGLNCYYNTLEMTHEHIKILFQILHANNRKKFPNKPRISFEKFKEGELSEEEQKWLWEASEDFSNNKEYGTLFLEFPDKTKYKLSDLKSRISELSNTIMDIHVCAVDYITLMCPVESDKARVASEDYNQMIKNFKHMAISHRNSKGESAPFIALTPAQISRKGLDEAVKNNNMFELDALRQYTELEGSADVVLTVMLLDEMRQAQEIQLQNLKNRSGKLKTDPYRFHIDLDYGMSISEISKKSAKEEVKALKDLDI
ncbi:MAG: DnaB-like helicase C-terminal domain-containing protein [Candidatus Pacearchaeota archaeon]